MISADLQIARQFVFVYLARQLLYLNSRFNIIYSQIHSVVILLLKYNQIVDSEAI